MGARNEHSLRDKKEEAINLTHKIESKAQIEGYTDDPETWPVALRKRYYRAKNCVEFCRWALATDRYLEL